MIVAFSGFEAATTRASSSSTLCWMTESIDSTTS
jgi:hypothetical protein